MTIVRNSITQDERRERGQRVEDHIKRLLAKYGKVSSNKDRKSWCDLHYENIPIDVKSAEFLIKNGNGCYTTGYFLCNSSNHQSLLAMDGWYCLVYMYLGTEIKELTRFVPADSVSHRGKRIFPQSLYAESSRNLERFVEDIKTFFKPTYDQRHKS